MDIKEIIKQIAKDNQVTPEEVEKEMRKSIRDAMQTKDPEAQRLWKQIAPDGKEPSIETFLKFCMDYKRRRK